MYTGIIIGYDPGGNNNHGVASLNIENGIPKSISSSTVQNAEEALRWFFRQGKPLAAGLDTLTEWCTGDSGWRPADDWLRNQYPDVRNSITAPNSLYGSMCLNGMAVILELRGKYPNIIITETHQKVLWHHHNSNEVYGNITNMNIFASKLLHLSVDVTSEHEWDAIISCYAALQGMVGNWTRNLHMEDKRETQDGRRSVSPVNDTFYFWPDDNNGKEYAENLQIQVLEM